MSEFSENLKWVMDVRNVNQKQLAEVLGIARETVNSYVSGKRTPDLEKLVKIANYLNVSIDDLAGRYTRQQELAITQVRIKYEKLKKNLIRYIQKSEI